MGELLFAAHMAPLDSEDQRVRQAVSVSRRKAEVLANIVSHFRLSQNLSLSKTSKVEVLFGLGKNALVIFQPGIGSLVNARWTLFLRISLIQSSNVWNLRWWALALSVT
jgi:hypothetical protein